MEHVKSFCESREERDDAKDNARECMELTHAVWFIEYSLRNKVESLGRFD